MRATILLASVLCVVLTPWTVTPQGRAKFVRTELNGYEEVPALSTPAAGLFSGRIGPFDTELTYQLAYRGLRAPVTQAHIHLGARGNNGGVMIWLCGTATNPGPAGTPTCPQEGAVRRTVFAADVIGPSGQGLAAGDFAEALRAIRSGVAYVNVHTTMFPGGEIRGQLREAN